MFYYCKSIIIRHAYMSGLKVFAPLHNTHIVTGDKENGEHCNILISMLVLCCYGSVSRASQVPSNTSNWKKPANRWSSRNPLSLLQGPFLKFSVTSCNLGGYYCSKPSVEDTESQNMGEISPCSQFY